MQRVFQFCYRYAWLILGLISAVTALAIWSATYLQVNVSADGLIPKQSEKWNIYENVRKEFGSDRLALIYAEDSNLFDREKLVELSRLVAKLRGLEDVERVESLFSVSNISGDGGWVETGALFETIPSSQAEIDKRKQLALKNPLLKRTVLSEDGKATLVTVYLKPNNEKNVNKDEQIYESINEVLTSYEDKFATLYQIGAPALHSWMAEFIVEDQKFLLPVSGLLLVLLIGLLLGSVQGAIIPVLNAAIATAWTLGLMAFLGIPISMLNYIVPALILIIGSTEDVHILVEYREARDAGLVGADAVHFIASRIGLTLVLTGFTTSFGFAVTGLSALSIMQEFGASAAIGMAARFLVSVFFVPAYLRLFGNVLIKQTHSDSEERRHNRMAARMGEIVERIFTQHAGRVIGIFALIALPCLFLIPTIKLSNDLIAFLHPESPIIEKLDRVADRLSGSKVIYVTLSGKKDDYKNADELRQLENITQWLRKDFDFDTVTSLSDYLALVNRAMFGDDPEMERVPEKDALIAQYYLFFHRSNLQPYVSGDYSKANIVIRCDINDSSRLNEVVNDIEQTLNSERFGPVKFDVTGKSVLVSSAVDKIVLGQVISLTTMVVTLFFIITILFLSFKAGAISVIANLFPVTVVFGIMAIFGIPLNIGTCMVAAITIGIAVDDSLHLMVRYNKKLKELKNEVSAMAASVKDEFFPVTTTSLGLAGGFIVLGFSSFVPVMQFGFLSAFVMILALITDLILTPTFLSTIRLITLWDLIGFKLRQTLLNTSPVFAGMTKWQAKRLILLADIQEYEAGSTVIKEGGIGRKMYVIIDGELEVSKTVGQEKLVLSTLGVGDLVGEVALVSETKRTADVTTLSNARVLALDWEALVRLHRSSPFLSSRLFLNLANILGTRLKDQLLKMDSKSPFGKKA